MLRLEDLKGAYRRWKPFREGKYQRAFIAYKAGEEERFVLAASYFDRAHDGLVEAAYEENREQYDNFFHIQRKQGKGLYWWQKCAYAYMAGLVTQADVKTKMKELIGRNFVEFKIVTDEYVAKARGFK